MPDSADRQLVEQAFDLVVACDLDPSPEHQRRLSNWRARSTAHARAADRALAQWQAMADLEHRPRNLVQKAQLGWQARKQQWRDYPGSRRFAAVAASALLVLAGGISQFAGWPGKQPSVAASPPAETVEYATGPGQRRQATLEDGSRVWLDWHSRLAVTFDSRQRHLRLERGSIAVQVMPDTDRPFTIETEGVLATALGTEYLVRRIAAQRVEVAVIEGEVTVRLQADTPAEAVGLSARQAVRVEANVLGPLRRRSLETLGAWRQGLVIFDDRPLLEAIEALAAYTALQVDTSQVAAIEQRVTGTFFVDRADAGLRSLMGLHRLEGTIKGNTLVLRQRPAVRP